MRNTLKKEALIFTIMLISVFFVSKTLVNREGVAIFDAIFSILDRDVAETKSIVWFANHPVDTQQQIEQCHQDSRLQASKNCENANTAYQMSKQTHANKTL